MSRLNRIVNARLTLLILLVIPLTACNTGTQAVANETWSLVELVTKGERTDVITEAVDVRNCGVVERKTIACSAGTSNEFSVSLGGAISGGQGFRGEIGANVSSGLGLGRNSGESLTLDLPPEGSVYRYTVKKEFSVLVGEVLARSSAGGERKAAYAFQASCSLKIEARDTLTCHELVPSLPQPALTKPPMSGNTSSQIATTTLTQIHPDAVVECFRYDPTNLQIVDHGAIGWAITDGVTPIGLLNDRVDAEQALELAKSYSQTCLVGERSRGHDMQYWEGESDVSSVLVDRDCIPYDPNNVKVVEKVIDEVPQWFIDEGNFHSMFMFDSEADALAALDIVKQNSQSCWIGRSNERSNRRDYIINYWK